MRIADFDFDDETPSSVAPELPPAPNETVVSRLADLAALGADEPAVADETTGLTRAELDAWSDRIARRLVALGLRREERVGVFMGRSVGYIAAAIGVLKAGGVHTPLDPTQPRARLLQLIEGAGPAMLIADAGTLGEARRLAWMRPGARALLCLDVDDPARAVETPGVMMSGELWNHVAGEADDDVGAGGWKSAFTGKPIPEEVMERFGDNAREKTAPILTPTSRVLEIGCASGFTMRRVAPLCGRYVASDLTRHNAERTEDTARRLGLGHVVGRPLASHDIDVLEPGSFDLVIMNSVIENFPGYAYLDDVLDKAITLLAPGGSLYLGGLWDMDRRDAYLGDLAAHARDHAGVGHATRLEFDEQLFVSRDYLRDWAARRPDRPSPIFSEVRVEGFDPAPYLFDCLVRTDGRGEGARPLLAIEGRGAIDGEAPVPPAVEIRPTDAAYVMFTSGTSGTPKGAWVEHRSLINLADAVEPTIYARLGAGARIRVTCVFAFGFDGSIHQIFTTLCNGHTLMIPSEETRRDPAALHAYIERNRIVCCDATPSLFRMLIDHWRETGTHTSARGFILGGEEVRTEMMAQLHEIPGHGDLLVINQYGPTETCVCATQYLMTAVDWRRQTPPPIGVPLRGVDVRLTDARGRDVPDGVPGEIRIGGHGVARGYLNDPERTAERFVVDPDGRRRYRTGDLARRLPSGDLVFMGREDRQVKIRGHRVELGEVETAIAAHPLVRRVAVVAAPGRDPGDKDLVAHVVPRPGFDAARVRADLERVMPIWTVPTWIVELDELPLTPNGKLDESRLPRPTDAAQRSARAPKPFETDVERRLAALWSKTLDLSIDDADADFFSVGGHSVLAVRLMSAIEREFGVRPPLADLLTHSTVARMATLIERRPTRTASPIVTVHETGTAPPLICFHPVGGNVLCYRELARELGPDQPIVMVRSADGEDGRPLPPTVETMVDSYMESLRAALPDGPVAVAGWSFGALLAWEAAGRLIRAGVDVRAVIALDGVAAPEVVRDLLRQDESDFLADLFDEMGLIDATTLRALDSEKRVDHILDRGKGGRFLPDDMDRDGMRRLLNLFQNNGLAAARYRPDPLDVRLLLVRPTEASRQAPGVPNDPNNGWGPVARRGVVLRWMSGTHGAMLDPDHVGELAAHVRAWLDEANRTGDGSQG